METYIPNADQLPKGEWYNVAMSVISGILTKYYEPRWLFGVMDHNLIHAVAELVIRLKRPSTHVLP